uniref:Uncharacterized protein n=1 Tax=Sphaerodactylus townsendi TaxID=933632 RepID=A0ACB8FUY1_9SAUR
MQMEWNWMAGGSVWITPSQRERTPPLQAFTWAGQHTVEEVVEEEEEEVVVEEEELAVDVIPTMTEGMTEDMTDMKSMIIAIGGDLLLLIIAVTDHDQDLVPTVQGAIEEQKPVTFANMIFKQQLLT